MMYTGTDAVRNILPSPFKSILSLFFTESKLFLNNIMIFREKWMVFSISYISERISIAVYAYAGFFNRRIEIW